MYTANAIITDVIVNQGTAWIQLSFEGKAFPVHYEFNLALLSDVTKLQFLIKSTKAGNIEGLRGKEVRIIDNEETYNSLVAIGSTSKNKFVDLYGGEFTCSEKGIYRRYRSKKFKFFN